MGFEIFVLFAFWDGGKRKGYLIHILPFWKVLVPLTLLPVAHS